VAERERKGGQKCLEKVQSGTAKQTNQVTSWSFPCVTFAVPHRLFTTVEYPTSGPGPGCRSKEELTLGA